MFLVGLAGFAAASALGGVADNFATFVSARALQGAFGAMVAPAALSNPHRASGHSCALQPAKAGDVPTFGHCG